MEPDRRQKPLRELPLLVGLLLGLVFHWWLGRAGVLDMALEGYRWPDHVLAAWGVYAEQPLYIDAFRQPFHGWLVALFIDSQGLPNAALLVALFSAWAMVLGAGLLGRGLAGPWAGGLAAATLPWVASISDASRWATPYPLLAAGAGLGLGLAALSWRTRPGVAASLGLLSGLATAFGWGVDERGLAFVPGALALLLLGLRKEPRWWLRLLALPLFAAGLAVAPVANDAIIPGREVMPVEERRNLQRGVAQRWIENSGDEVLQAACAEHQELLLEPEVLRTSCASGTLKHNLGKKWPTQLPFGTWLSLLALPFVLLPDRKGWRGSLAAAGGLGLALAGMGALATLTVMPERYLIQLGVPLASIVPVGLAKASRLAPERFARWLTPALLLAAAALGWVLDLGFRQRPSELRLDRRPFEWTQAAKVVRARVTDGDRLLDCSRHYVDLQIQPGDTYDLERGFMSGQPNLNPDHERQCRAWADSPPEASGQRWLAAVPGSALSQRIERRGTWELEASHGEFELWRYLGSD